MSLPTYRATTKDEMSSRDFQAGEMQNAKRFAVSLGNGGHIVDLETGQKFKVTRKGVEDFFSLKEIKTLNAAELSWLL